ncbi:MAG TPA: ribosomal RNA small subunit methyltransferase I, partial [Gaiellaceae bacterium]|nr:ribosomal RNA small subunit methyltransferase I [Gaiellaceae bacterium]
TRVLLDRHGISGKLVSYHEHNEAKRAAEVLPRMEAGERFALVSDAGMPAISDPGARLVAAALERGVPVTVLPGPTAVDTALVASGFPAERYQFVGFVPRGARALASLWEEFASWPYPVVAFESPRRLPATLRSLADAQPAREVAVCRELTKKFEEVVRGTAAELAARFAEAPKGEITLVLGPGSPSTDVDAAIEAVGELVSAGLPRKQAADVVSRLTGASRNELYRRTL